VRETAPLREMADRFLTSSNNFLPVVNVQNRLCGMIALQDLKEELNTGQDIQGVIAYDLMRPPPAFLTPNQRLIDVLPVLLSADLRNIPVVNNVKELGRGPGAFGSPGPAVRGHCRAHLDEDVTRVKIGC
jgi:CIC family chloride channel protein